MVSEQEVLGGTRKTMVWESANQGLPLTPHTPPYPMTPCWHPHLDSAAPEEREVADTEFRLPGIGVLGVTDNDRLVEAGIEVKCQIS